MNMEIKILPQNITDAANRIENHIRKTPLEFSPYYSDMSGSKVWLKLENLQITGSFKARGAFNKVLLLSEQQKRGGCVTASSGNHGAASAYAMKELGIAGLVFVPEGTSSIKVDAIKRSGCEVRFFGKDGVDTENYARRYAAENKLTFLSPYNDEEVISGQGTCGKEIVSQLPQCDAVFVAIGGGGLISGIAAYMKSLLPDIQVIGCQPSASAVMTHSIKSGKIIDMISDPTLSDGTAGGIEEGAITFDLCQKYVDHYELVSEQQIKESMQTFIDVHRMLIEGAAGVALAGFLARKDLYKGKNVAIVVCGGNISRKTLASVI
jgi:threonine dehydratase